jgi:hypothetical protein
VTEEPFVSGPHLVHEVHPEMGTALGTLWLAVTRAGGAVGFPSDAALGLEQLLLSARGGTGIATFYTRQGWTQVGVFPASLRLGPDDIRDEHWFQLRLS